MSDLLAVLGIGAIGVVLIIALVALFFVIGTAITAVFVALIWNWIGLHTVFGLGVLSFWGCVGIAAAINLVTGAIRPPVSVN